MIKKFTLLCAVILMVFALIACGSDDSKDSKETEAQGKAIKTTVN